MKNKRNLADKDMKIEKRIMQAIDSHGVHVRKLYYDLGIDCVTLARIIENLHVIGVIDRRDNIISLVKDVQ